MKIDIGLNTFRLTLTDEAFLVANPHKYPFFETVLLRMLNNGHLYLAVYTQNRLRDDTKAIVRKVRIADTNSEMILHQGSHLCRVKLLCFRI